MRPYEPTDGDPDALDPLEELERLQSLSRLVDGVTHDFTPLLRTIIGYAEWALARPLSESLTREALRVIIDAGQRATRLNRQLYESSHARLPACALKPPAPRRIDLSAFVELVAPRLREAVPPRASLCFDLAPDLPAVECFLPELEEVTARLVASVAAALDGLPGMITLRTGVVSDPKPFVLLEVSCAGRELDPAALARLADPSSGEAAMLHGIARTNGWQFRAASEPGTGIRFRVLLPARPASPRD